MAPNFTNAEAALVAELRTLTFLDSDNCKAGDLDSVFQHISEQNETYFCLTDYRGGSNAGRGIWTHRVLVSIAVKFSDTIETDLRSAADEVLILMTPQNDLGGAVMSARIASADPPIKTTINKEMFVVVFFNVDIDERMSACP